MRRLLISIFMIALLAVSVSAEITLLSPEDAFYSSPKPQQFSFRIAENPDNCTLNANGAPVKTIQNVYANQTLTISYELTDGAYDWSVSCRAPSQQINSQPRSLILDTSKPVVSLQAPSNGAKVNSNRVTFIYASSDSNLKSCDLRVKIGSSWLTLHSR